MNSVKVRNVVIGEGKPKICVPIVGITKDEIINEAKKIKELPVDVVEWRVDWFENALVFEKVLEVLSNLREVLGDIPLLMTFRTSKEGGEKSVETEVYEALNIQAAQSGYVDLVDVELFKGDETVKRIIASAHACGVKVIVSNHDFHQTPSRQEIIARLRKMQAIGADIPKIAVMPQNRKDVLTLMAATEEMYAAYADRPIITMSMSGQGVISRLSGEIFGSALTFGAAGKISAPGQVAVLELVQVLDLLHRNI